MVTERQLVHSSEQVGTGAAQNIAHGLGVTPTKVVITPTESQSGGGRFTATEGTHDVTNVKLTVTSGERYKVRAS
jgi:hypothetical protein